MRWPSALSAGLLCPRIKFLKRSGSGAGKIARGEVYIVFDSWWSICFHRGLGSAARWLCSRGSLTMWLEERETQAAESWRVREFMPFPAWVGGRTRLRRSCVFVDTRFVSFPQGIGADEVSGLVKSNTQAIPWSFPSRDMPESIFQT